VPQIPLAGDVPILDVGDQLGIHQVAFGFRMGRVSFEPSSNDDIAKMFA
jgi:hypothetical protein